MTTFHGEKNPYVYPLNQGVTHAENTVGDALQRKLERLNSTIMSQDEQVRRQHMFFGHSGYSEDSDYTSDLNYPIGQHPNSSASQFRSAAQLMRTPDRSLETSRENSYERDEIPGQVHIQGNNHLITNNSYQQGGCSAQNYSYHQQSYRNYNEVKDGTIINICPVIIKPIGHQILHNRIAYDGKEVSNTGTKPEQYQNYGAQNYTEYYNEDYGYQNESCQNRVNKRRSSKILPANVYSNSSQNNAYYNAQRDDGREIETVDGNGGSTMSTTAAARRKLLKQQRQSSENYGSATGWQSNESGTVWESAENYNYYYSDYNLTGSTVVNAASPVSTPVHPHKKRTLPQIRAVSRNKTSSVSLPQTPIRQLPNPMAAINKQRVSAPVSRTTSADYEQNDFYDSRTFNENYNYAYVSSDNLLNEKFGGGGGGYSTDVRNSENYNTNYETTEKFDNYENKENYPEVIDNYQNVSDHAYHHQDVGDSSEQYQNIQNQNSQDKYYAPNYFQEDNLKNYYETDVTDVRGGQKHKEFLDRRANSPFVQQNTDSLESRDDELRDESFETAVDSICSSIPLQKGNAEYSSVDPGYDYKFEPPKPLLQQSETLTPQAQSQRVLGGLFGQLTKSASQNVQQQQTQKPDQRSRDQPNLLTNPALAAMNVTKGFFSSISNASQHTPQDHKTIENQISTVSKRGSLKQQDSVESEHGFKSNQNYYDNQVQDYIIPEEPEYSDRKEEEYFENQDKYYDFDERDYYENEEKDGFSKEGDLQPVSELDQLESELRKERARNADNSSFSKKTGYLRHQDTVESEGKRSDYSNRGYLRQQDSLESCDKDPIMRHSSMISEPSSPVMDNRYDNARVSVPDALRHGMMESNHMDGFRKRGSGHDNSLIEPYHPNDVDRDIAKDYPTSPPAIQKQPNVDLEGIEEEEVPNEPSLLPEDDKPICFEVEPEESMKVPVPERRKYTAKERWHRAYNIVVQQINDEP
ncbi:hypothetical protein Phum_PHUM400680 [Pediculus humanus corporis]|uniref:Uncharacterized protein n=1 Tax=Pediculus humanus subsp. corporis TaxID=121224 RepID=E0VRP6_PEDHC|nr:uncharacterized protein Phum_PHUM400680 [Pediculus humanus corporis]EEB16052.1 hypothetical protein Phum_PHUM400680 [Pediculus humanus corporis]